MGKFTARRRDRRTRPQALPLKDSDWAGAL